MLERLADTITFRQYGRRGLIRHAPTGEDIAGAREAMRECNDAVRSGSYDVVILDEVNVAVFLGLISVEEVLGLIRGKRSGVELVLTGRNAHDAVIEEADLVTEMRAIKHYYEKGVKARRGIEK